MDDKEKILKSFSRLNNKVQSLNLQERKPITIYCDLKKNTKDINFY